MSVAVIKEQHAECSVHELDLHRRLPVQTSIVATDQFQLKPTSTHEHGSTIEFIIRKSSKYTDLADTLLEVEVDIVKQTDRTARVTEADECAPVCNFLHSLFRDVQVLIGDGKVSGNADTYPYRAYFDNLMSRTPAEKKTWLYNEMWHQDTPGHFNSRGADNVGFKARQKRAINGPIKMIGKLHIDMANQHKLIPSNTDIHIRLVRSSPAFCLMGKADCVFIPHIKDISLRVRQCTVSNEVMMTHEKAVRLKPFEYAIQRVNMMAHVIPANQRNDTYVLSNSGQLPTHVLYALVNNSAFNGDFTKNPFNFEHMNLNKFQIVMNDRKIPADAYCPDYQNKNYSREYDAFYRESGLMADPHGCDIAYKDFDSGNTIYPIDLTPDRSNNVCRATGYTAGQFREDVTFRVGLPQTTTALNYIVFDNTVYITQDRQPTTDYSLG